VPERRDARWHLAGRAAGGDARPVAATPRERKRTFRSLGRMPRSSGPLPRIGTTSPAKATVAGRERRGDPCHRRDRDLRESVRRSRRRAQRRLVQWEGWTKSQTAALSLGEDLSRPARCTSSPGGRRVRRRRPWISRRPAPQTKGQLTTMLVFLSVTSPAFRACCSCSNERTSLRSAPAFHVTSMTAQSGG
jgi:hypothetical protein